MSQCSAPVYPSPSLLCRDHHSPLGKQRIQVSPCSKISLNTTTSTPRGAAEGFNREVDSRSMGEILGEGSSKGLAGGHHYGHLLGLGDFHHSLHTVVGAEPKFVPKHRDFVRIIRGGSYGGRGGLRLGRGNLELSPAGMQASRRPNSTLNSPTRSTIRSTSDSSEMAQLNSQLPQDAQPSSQIPTSLPLTWENKNYPEYTRDNPN